MEVMHRVWKDEDELAGRLAYEECQLLSVEWIPETRQLLEASAKIKATSKLSVVDAWIAASALQEGAILVHKDPELITIECSQPELPYKLTYK